MLLSDHIQDYEIWRNWHSIYIGGNEIAIASFQGMNSEKFSNSYHVLQLTPVPVILFLGTFPKEIIMNFANISYVRYLSHIV